MLPQCRYIIINKSPQHRQHIGATSPTNRHIRTNISPVHYQEMSTTSPTYGHQHTSPTYRNIIIIINTNIMPQHNAKKSAGCKGSHGFKIVLWSRFRTFGQFLRQFSDTLYQLCGKHDTNLRGNFLLLQEIIRTM